MSLTKTGTLASKILMYGPPIALVGYDLHNGDSLGQSAGSQLGFFGGSAVAEKALDHVLPGKYKALKFLASIGAGIGSSVQAAKLGKKYLPIYTPKKTMAKTALDYAALWNAGKTYFASPEGKAMGKAVSAMSDDAYFAGKRVYDKITGKKDTKAIKKPKALGGLVRP